MQRTGSIASGPAWHRHCRRLAASAAAGSVTLLLSGCGQEIQRGLLPTDKNTTNQTAKIMELWNGSWIAALLVGVLVWGLILWCVVAYRRRRDETGLPPQVRYHLPLEILYTIVPLMMIAPLFFFTVRDQTAIADTSAEPDLTINVVGKRWAWDFNYLNATGNTSDNVYDYGVQGQLDGTRGVQKELPTLYLPVNKRVEFILTSRDVIHSFWIPAFLYKLDMIPGTTNTFQVVPQRIGTFKGKCAELCGEYHSEMLFNVRVVEPAEYEAHMAELRERGQTGSLPTDLGPSDLVGDGNGNPVDEDGTGSD